MVVAKLLAVAVLSLLLLSPMLLSQMKLSNPDKYISTFKRFDEAFRDLLDDLASAMGVAERFKDINYEYEAKHLEEAINKDGRNGTEELINVFNDLMESIRHDLNISLERRP